jgi:hypothetical protein
MRFSSPYSDAIPAYIDQLARPPSREKLQSAAPYKIYKFKP